MQTHELRVLVHVIGINQRNGNHHIDFQINWYYQDASLYKCAFISLVLKRVVLKVLVGI